MTDQYAVIGNPIAHSLSPQIHALFAEQTGEDLHYDKIHAEKNAFADAATRFFDAGGRGMNVTLPFKQSACRFADTLSERAKHAQAVNTLIRHTDGQITGDNTDGTGLVRDLTRNLNLEIAHKNILILGAGGAVRGVLGSLLEQHPASLTIANRTAEKASDLAQHFSVLGVVRGTALHQTAKFAPYDLIINGTSAGVTGSNPDLPDGLFAQQCFAYDMFYAAAPTPFICWAKVQHAAGHADGFGMLVEQAAESFSLWRGKQPDTRPVIGKLRP